MFEKMARVTQVFITSCMYTRSGRLQLPYSELTEEVKAAKARIYTTFEESNDPCVRGAELKVDGERKSGYSKECH